MRLLVIVNEMGNALDVILVRSFTVFALIFRRASGRSAHRLGQSTGSAMTIDVNAVAIQIFATIPYACLVTLCAIFTTQRVSQKKKRIRC